jgi:hypothetical protein
VNNEIAVYEGAPPALRVEDMRAQVNLIQDVMKSVMRDKEHYGTIPGCGDKPTLLQPGAQKLIMTFRLVPDPEVEIIDLPHAYIIGHREYRVKVRLHTQNGIFLGAGVGSCSTMEGKFRYRKADLVCPECGQTAIIKGKAEFGGGWICYGKKGGCGKKWTDAESPFDGMSLDKAEHDNPADYYNTCEKMAYKRALVSATLTVTAASDIFTQDIEDMPEVIPGGGHGKDSVMLNGTTGKPPIKQPEKKTETAKKPPTASGNTITGIIDTVSKKTGTGKKGAWTKFGIKIGEDWFGTFDKTIGELAESCKGFEATITWKQDGDFKTCEALIPTTTTASTDPEGCTKDPARCDFSIWGQNEGDPVICGQDGPECSHKKASAA